MTNLEYTCAAGATRYAVAHTSATMSRRGDVRQQPIEFLLYNLVALAGSHLQTRPIAHCDVAAAVFDEPVELQLARCLGDGLAAHAEHIGDELLSHAQFVGRQAIQAQQQPATQLLID